MASWSVDGFKCLRFKISHDSIITHSLFIKQHSVREKSKLKPGDRTLFVLNVPPFVNEEFFTGLFNTVGKVEKIHLCDKPTSSDRTTEEESMYQKHKTGYKVAYVVFQKADSLKKCLKLDELKPNEDAPKISCGIMAMINDYNTSIPDIKELQKKLDAYMLKYDQDVKEKIEREKSMGEADDEGWVTVTKQGRKPGFERKESVTGKIAATKNAQQQKKELKNFYTFQIRESKMNHIVALRQKFEEDKKKIALLKQSRRFKPF